MEQNNQNSKELLQLVSFNMGDEEYGIDILKVQEIIRFTEITRIPNAPCFVDGVINLRSKVIPVIDLRTRLGMERKERSNSTRIIVVEISGRTTGFKVDGVNEVLRIPENITEAPPEIATGNGGEYITSVARLEDRLLMLLDLEKILCREEKEQLMDAL